jgi:protein-S-isoprenylcysteine O-methyltransferase Ste14
MIPPTRWNIAAGQFFFKHRNALFPVIFFLGVVFMRPRLMLASPTLDHFLIIVGALVALGGEAIRLITIGFDYIDRGGKNKQVWASRLVQGGVYAHTRNPMYLGNCLIAIGMCMCSGAPMAYLVLIPAFLFIYQAIMSAEEAYLRQRFGKDYDAYCCSVPRVFPRLRQVLRSFEGMSYNWKRAIRQDLSTIAGLLAALALWPVWRVYFLEGVDAAKAIAPRAIILALVVLGLYIFLHYLKKSGRFKDSQVR